MRLLGALLATLAVFPSTSSQRSAYSSCSIPADVGDGYCDNGNNTSECDYDGGDCCSCTCVDGDYECGFSGYDCVDPEAGCYFFSVAPTPADGMDDEVRLTVHPTPVDGTDDDAIWQSVHPTPADWLDDDIFNSTSSSIGVGGYVGIALGGLFLVVAFVFAGVFFTVGRQVASLRRQEVQNLSLNKLPN